MKRVFGVVFLIAISFSVLPSRGYLLDEVGEEVKLYLGEAKILSVSNPKRVVLGNPNIADVTNVTKNEITLIPKDSGTTTLVIWDDFGEQSYKLIVLKENMLEIKRRADTLLANLNFPEVYTQVAEEENKVFILGNVKTAQDRERVNLALDTLKDKVVDLIVVKEEEAVVEIDVQVLELNKDATDTLGFTWPASITLTERGSPGIATTGTKWSSLFNVLNLSRDAFTWTLDALVQEGKARILSRPRLACQSGKEAELLVGGEKPILTTTVSEGSTGTEVEYKEYGIKLNIKPVIDEKKRIKLALNVEVSEVESAVTIGGTTTTALAYPLKKRSASTELYLDDGQTMAIGGLIKQKLEEDIRKTPWLADVPVLGLFFKKKTTMVGGGQGQRGDTELFITLTPKIVSAGKENSEKKTEEIKKPAVSIDERPLSPLQGYAALIQRRILDNLNYPASAREAGFQGTVILNLRLSYQGELLEALLKKSSGYNILDDNSISIAESIGSYPPFPASIDKDEVWIEIPITYRLD